MPRSAHKEFDCEFDFDDWARLAADDPDAFETRRRAAIEDALERVPAERRERLRRLQWRIDRTRDHAPSALSACIRLSNMMWNSVTGDRGLLAALDAVRAGRSLTPRHTARILSFPSKRRNSE